MIDTTIDLSYCDHAGEHVDPFHTAAQCPWPLPKCIEDGDKCEGETRYRESLTGTGTPIPRCEAHWSKRLDLEQDLRRRYPEQEPADFDPLYAGESWNDD